MPLDLFSSVPYGCFFASPVSLLFSYFVTEASRACLAEGAQSLAIRSPDAADAYLELRLDSGSETDRDMAPEDGGSKNAANSSGAPKGRALSAKEKKKAAAEKRLATIRRNKQAEAAANSTRGAFEPGSSKSNTSTGKMPATAPAALLASAAAAASAELAAPSTRVADGAALPPVVVSPPARGEAASMPNVQSPRQDVAGSVPLTDTPAASGSPPLAAGADALPPFLHSTDDFGRCGGGFQGAGWGHGKISGGPSTCSKACVRSVGDRGAAGGAETRAACHYSQLAAKQVTGSAPGWSFPAPAAGTASAAIGGPVPPVSLTFSPGGRTSTSSSPSPQSEGASAAAAAGAQSAVDATAASAQEALARLEAEAMRHRRAAAAALVEARRLRLLAQEQRAGLVPPELLSTIGDPHDGLAAAEGGARPAGDAALVEGSGAASKVDDGKPVHDAGDAANPPPVGSILPVDVGGLGGDGRASRALPIGALHGSRPAPSSAAVHGDKDHPPAKFSKKRSL